MTTRDFSGSTALVTGAARRLGRAIALALAREGANVALHYRNSREDAESLAGELQELGVRAWCFQADLADCAAVESLYDDAVRAAGHIDILVNNASIFPESTLWDVSEVEIFENLHVNALAPLWLCRRMAAQGGPGAIVNLLDSRVTEYDKRHVAYHLSKRMLFSLTRMMAVEFAPAIRVNGVAPGLVLPPEGKDAHYLEELARQLPLQRHGAAGDVAEAVVFLLKSSFVTGQVIFVDGGRHLEGDFYG
jgi:pteridine reductase